MLILLTIVITQRLDILELSSIIGPNVNTMVIVARTLLLFLPALTVVALLAVFSEKERKIHRAVLLVIVNLITNLIASYAILLILGSEK